MRKLAIVTLTAVPIALVAWVVHQGLTPPPPERLTAAAKPAAPPGAQPSAPAAAAASAKPADADGALLALFDGLLGPGEKAKLYDSNGLFDYIDGGAPVFIERGFRRLGAAELKLEGSDVVCDVYDMATPENSTAIFNKEKSSNAKAVEGWPAAISGAMSFVFHSGPYYIKLTAFDPKGEAQLAKLAQKIKERTATPPVAIATGAVAKPAGEPAVAAAPSGEEDKALAALFDGELGGAKVKEKVALYDSKGLFDYIDGGAPVFIERGFRKLAATELASAEGSDLDCAVYDMAKPENAKAIFEKERSKNAQPVDGWDEAITGNLSFVFWSDRYYVKLTSFDARGESALFPLAKALRRKAR
ncbi:MAG: hypothetical protein QM765_10640 [Myxococcales bacterium]